MSTINVTNLKHASSGSNNIVLDSSGNATVAGTLANTGNLTITSGNLVLSSGNGIDFSATSDAGGMTSELLDDYEEGTFTPTVTGETSAGTTTYSSQYGLYTKIGRQVTVAISVTYTAATGTGFLKIGGFPFAANSSTNRYIAPIESSSFNWAGGTYLVAYLESSNSFCYVTGDADDAARVFQTLSNEAATLSLTMTYFV